LQRNTQARAHTRARARGTASTHHASDVPVVKRVGPCQGPCARAAAAVATQLLLLLPLLLLLLLLLWGPRASARDRPGSSSEQRLRWRRHVEVRLVHRRALAHGMPGQHADDRCACFPVHREVGLAVRHRHLVRARRARARRRQSAAAIGGGDRRRRSAAPPSLQAAPGSQGRACLLWRERAAPAARHADAARAHLHDLQRSAQLLGLLRRHVAAAAGTPQPRSDGAP
jgi:hypothetical protein